MCHAIEGQRRTVRRVSHRRYPCCVPWGVRLEKVELEEGQRGTSDGRPRSAPGFVPVDDRTSVERLHNCRATAEL